MDERPILVLVGRQRPHHVLLLVYGMGIGIAYLTGSIPPSRIGALSAPIVTAWMAGLVVSGVVGLVGAFWHGQIRAGLMLERAAMLIGAGSVFGLAYKISEYLPNAAFTVGFCVAWGIANLVLAAQIGKDLRSLGRKKTENAGGYGERGGASHRGPIWWGSDRNRPSPIPPPEG